MNHEQGDTGDAFNTSPKSTGDAATFSRTGTPMPARKRPSLSPKKEDFDVRRILVSWSTEQLSQLQPWKLFLDTGKFSIPKSSHDIGERIHGNFDRFRSNYGVVFFGLLACYVVFTPALLVGVAVAVAVCAALKVHLDDDTALLLGTSLALSKNQRLVLAGTLALPLLYFTDLWSGLICSFATSMALGMIHATLFSGLGPAKTASSKKLPEIPEIPGDGDISGHL
ncbi:hypothetical protein V5799_023768 [Amblyomma americanum]|uniref:PRA1 family protein n=1 Tax=Amblyomma americanum TaxID=6943 RepID=A0AAQ4FIN0_AMBAM